MGFWKKLFGGRTISQDVAKVRENNANANHLRDDTITLTDGDIGREHIQQTQDLDFPSRSSRKYGGAVMATYESFFP